MIKVRGGYVCVVHGHPQKKGSKRDKPIGTAIKCYSIKKYGKKGAMKKAQAMHFAIRSSQQRRGG